MSSILVVNGHPHENLAVANREIMEQFRKQFPKAEFSDLGVEYPDYKINVKSEQEKLRNADVIIIQTPLFWYSVSSLIKRWFEEVFTYGWAYGSNGYALEGKKVIIGFTAGQPTENYLGESVSGIKKDEITKPSELIFKYCKMDYLGCVLTGGMAHNGMPDDDRTYEIRCASVKHVEEMASLIRKDLTK